MRRIGDEGYAAIAEPGALTAAVDAAVAEQYLRYPYPPRDPANEREPPQPTWLGHLPRINGLFWGGRRRINALRFLDAGCGTGDAAICLAHQAPAAEVVALDASASALEVARQRAGNRGLRNISFHNAALLDVPRLGLGTFDYIVCSGVLHHLADPPAGLSALVDVLADGGGLGIMLYAPFGRAPVYQVQEAIRRVAGAEPLDARLAVAREVLAALPARHFFKAGDLEHEFLDAAAGPSGVVDLLLHARDRAYSVPEVHGLLEQAGLQLLGFEPSVLYRPESYPLGPELRRRVSELPEHARQAVAELINGRFTTHRFYATRAGSTPDAPGADAAADTICPSVYEPALAAYFAQLSGPQPFNLESAWGFSINLTLGIAEVELLRGLDGMARLDEILARAARSLAASGITETAAILRQRWDALYDALSVCGFAGYHWAER